ncbi:hypothetical protein F3157_19245 [Virgibacillus dakarensis]|uniref:YegS/DAGK C-terminal domain-containing protein n=1 Tax=Lentibacillus populi TaxID=1827502 RepID=A0A9W5X3I2_9BACI|nr:hypothetical protein [Lentibacillus populi]MBT2216630.1 hypothetical protein [Virgibacillus dakarensis]MTW87755.1 hypothetical protein [Virgibacillus dakarensis]GGB27048.1 hypothetical protein GCM10011409_00430 [Lentibacillus populi]
MYRFIVNPIAGSGRAKRILLLIHSISKWKVLALFLTVFTGKHVNFKEVAVLNANQLKMVADSEVAYQVDGQTSRCLTCTVSKQVQPISIKGVKQLDKFEQANL